MYRSVQDHLPFTASFTVTFLSRSVLRRTIRKNSALAIIHGAAAGGIRKINRLLPASRHTKNADNHDTLTVRRLPISRNLLFDAPAAIRQPTASHIWHLINIHRAAIALPASSLCSTHRPSMALQLFSKPLAVVRVLQGATSR